MSFKAKSLVVLVVIVSLGLAACAGSQPAASIGGVDIIGVWKQEGETYFQLNEDGTYRTAASFAFLEQAPLEVGQFQLEGTSFTFITSDESFECTGLEGSYELELTEQGQLRFVVQEDACEMRGIVFSRRPWDRVEP
jgi:hypothetical protein